MVLPDLYQDQGVYEMNITIIKTVVPVPITIMHLDGKLDRTNYKTLVSEAEKIHEDGARNLILDLSGLTFISSAGMAGLHQVALIFREGNPANEEEGWAVFHAIDRDRSRGTQEHVKLLYPVPRVREVLDMAGFDSLFEIYDDLPKATASFSQLAPVRETNH